MQWTSDPNIGEAPLPQRARGYWKARFSAVHEELEKLLEVERAQLPPWLAVGFGSGIAAWFALDQPGQWSAFLCIAAALALAGFVVGGGRSGRALGWFALTALLGCALVWARAEWIAAPRLVRPVVAEVAGQVESVDHLAARDTVRLTLRTSDSALPPRVRVSVDEDRAPPGLARGSIVRLRARLAPPPPMALPGTYDFARDAWFQGIGAVGKSFGSVAVIRAAAPRGIEPPDFAFEALTAAVFEAVPVAVEPSTLAAASSVRLTEASAASLASRALATLFARP
jgi:competence protein ComEC